MAISTGTKLKMVQVSTQAKYNDITPKDPGTLYWVVETRKIYLDGTPYGFNWNDVSGDIEDLIIDQIDVKVLNKVGQTNGIASLDHEGKIPTAQLPSYVDDVLEFSIRTAFPSIGEAGKIYVDKSTNKTYRWGGSIYVEISPSLALGITSSTAFRGDYGNTAFQHLSKTDNPHGVTKSQVGLGMVQNYGLSSQAQAEAGTSDTVYMTPLRTKQAIDELAPKVTWTVIS